MLNAVDAYWWICSLICRCMLIDVDECESARQCANGQCVNTEGGYRCVCAAGYHLNVDGTDCEGTFVSLSVCLSVCLFLCVYDHCCLLCVCVCAFTLADALNGK